MFKKSFIVFAVIVIAIGIWIFFGGIFQDQHSGIYKESPEEILLQEGNKHRPRREIAEILEEDDIKIYLDLDRNLNKKLQELLEKDKTRVEKIMLNKSKTEILNYNQSINRLLSKYGPQLYLLRLKLDYFRYAFYWGQYSEEEFQNLELTDKFNEWRENTDEDLKKHPYLKNKIRHIKGLMEVGVLLF